MNFLYLLFKITPARFFLHWALPLGLIFSQFLLNPKLLFINGSVTLSGISIFSPNYEKCFSLLLSLTRFSSSFKIPVWDVPLINLPISSLGKVSSTCSGSVGVYLGCRLDSPAQHMISNLFCYPIKE
jgi:hypothetical protein